MKYTESDIVALDLPDFVLVEKPCSENGETYPIYLAKASKQELEVARETLFDKEIFQSFDEEIEDAKRAIVGNNVAIAVGTIVVAGGATYTASKTHEAFDFGCGLALTMGMAFFTARALYLFKKQKAELVLKENDAIIKRHALGYVVGKMISEGNYQPPKPIL